MDWVPIVAAVLGAGGLGALLREAVSAVRKVMAGMAARESSRKRDIVQQRDAAAQREARAWAQVDREAAKRRQVQDYAAALRRQLIEAGVTPLDEPVLERTVTKAQLRELRDKE